MTTLNSQFLKELESAKQELSDTKAKYDEETASVLFFNFITPAKVEPWQGSYVFAPVCLSVCPGCYQDRAKSS